MSFSRKYLGIPYGLFLILFVAAPLLVLVYYAFTNGQGQFSMVNLQNFFTDPNTLGTLCYSLVLAFVATAVCLIIAYPVAYILSQSKLKRKAVILLLFVMPMWINFTLRITALKDFQTFIKVILPLSVPGIVSGVSMVFLPAMTNYVVLDMLYNSTYIMGSLIGSYFSAYDWHNGSMIALILLVIICIVTLVSGDKESENAGRGGLV